MRISDWSSDVCSSDLHRIGTGVGRHGARHMRPAAREDETVDELRPARMAIKRIGVGGQPLAHLDRGKDRLDNRERPFLRRARRAVLFGEPAMAVAARAGESLFRKFGDDEDDLVSARQVQPLTDIIVCIAQRAVKRSEEHTSELQSLMRISYAVFCLKKKITNNT